jgi:hypothetical protein
MEIKFDFNRMDYWNFTKFHFVHKPLLRGILIFYLAVILFVSVISILDGKGIGFVIFTLIFFIVVYFILKLVAMRAPASKAGTLGEHSLTATDEGLIEITSVKNSFTKWQGVLEILMVKNYIIIYIDNMAAHVIPKRAFINEQEAVDFYHRVMELWKKAI